MYRIFYSERNATLYEKLPNQNTSLDEVLQLIKITCGSRYEGNDLSSLGAISANTYNSRILLDFGTEIDTLRTEINNGNIPPLGAVLNSSASVYLSLHAVSSTDLSQEYTLFTYPVSESWSTGRGFLNSNPKQKDGTSWYYKDSDDIGTYWKTGSAHSKNTSQGTTEKFGGGTWITGSGYEASQSFKNTVPDIRMNVTDIVNKWVTNDISNYGFILKRTYSDEISGNVFGNVNFFSRETHTIFVPRLEVCWNDVVLTGSNSTISSDIYVPYIKNIKPEYKISEIAKFYIGVRPAFPTRTYSTSSFYSTTNVLPLSSSYEIIDSVTNDIIISDTSVFSLSCTKISKDSNGSYFKLRMDSFMPERFYKIKLKCVRDADTQVFDDFYFKVVN